MFEHDAPDVAARMLDSLEKPWYQIGLEDSLKMYLMDEQGNFDILAENVFHTTSIIARPWVLYQWFSVLKTVHTFYTDLKLPSYEQFAKEINTANRFIMENSIKISERKVLRFEAGIGSDVGQAQQSEETENSPDDEGNPSDGRALSEVLCHDPVIQCSFVLNSPTTAMFDVRESQEACFRATSQFLDIAITLPDFLLNADPQTEERANSQRENRFQEVPEEVIRDAIRRASRNLTNTYREDQVISEFTRDDYGLTTAFPTVFVLGRAYGKAAGSLSKRQLGHLLHQFTNAASDDKQLLAYLNDVRSRFDVIHGVNAHVRGNKQAIAVITDLLQDATKRATLKKALDNPEGKDAKAVLRSVLPHLQFCARKMQYTTLSGSFNMMQILDMARRYGPPSCFLTLSFCDAKNVRALRATYRTINNKQFPAIFELNCPHGTNVKEYMKLLYEASMEQSNGTMRMHPEHSREFRADRARKNPVAYVTESKKMISNFCSVLLGLSPEDFFYSNEGTTRRATRYYKHNKGIFGHPLAYLAVVEDHAKGTLHYHLIFFGGLPPYVLQSFAGIQDLCDTIASVLDSMYRATLPRKTHIDRLTQQIMKQWSGSNFDGSIFRHLPEPHLLARSNPMGSRSYEGNITKVEIDCATILQAVDQQIHKHMHTCHKGVKGLTGCRLDRKSGPCLGTHPIRLVPIEIGDSIAEEYEERTEGERISGEPIGNQGTGRHSRNDDTDGPNSFEMNEKFPFSVEDPVLSSAEENSYHTKNPFLRNNASTQDGVLVWELNRCIPEPLFPMETMMEQDTEEVLGKLVNRSQYFFPNTPFWNWLCHCESDKRLVFLAELQKRLKHANNYVVEHNTIASYCLGSHNNAQLLGTNEQAESAMLYVGPYMVKNKFPLLHSLSLLNNVIEDVEQHPSTAEDTGTQERTVKHVLMRMLNKLNLKMELSEYQVAASLLGLPSVICSDKFTYSDPNADMGYQTHIQMHNNQEELLELRVRNNEHRQDLHDMAQLGEHEADFVVNEETLTMEEIQFQHNENTADCMNLNDLQRQHLGRVLPFQLTGQEGQQGQRILVPVCSFYPSRGPAFAQLNREEYASLVEIKPSTIEKENQTKQRQKRFPLSPGHPLYPQYEQVLRQKQRVNICTRRNPNHPGPCPVDDPQSFQIWKKKRITLPVFFDTISARS
jgi:hypothetical protein